MPRDSGCPRRIGNQIYTYLLRRNTGQALMEIFLCRD